ncbi:50S ribosomal protein L3 [symbiont of Argiope bruennichi]|uniref:50S ribosomal protein L3 n=1 Tax=symbiont of Argiope bruennichi TaxID=2810479 RepID=UPI003DA40469
MIGIYAIKVGMTTVYKQNNEAVPTTVIKLLENQVIEKKTKEKHGYEAIKVGFFPINEKRVSKPHKGHFVKHQLIPKKHLKEIRDFSLDIQVKDVIPANCFDLEKKVNVTAVSKGKGFAGVIKRWNQSRGPMAHGSGFHRGIGSMGAISPNRVFKSKNMPGRMGHEKITTKNLQILEICEKDEYLLIKGSVPGPNNSIVFISQDKYSKKCQKPELFKNKN